MEILLNSEKVQTTDTHSDMNEKSQHKENKLCNSTCSILEGSRSQSVGVRDRLPSDRRDLLGMRDVF